MGEQTDAGQVERRASYVDGRAILDAVAGVKEDLGREIREVKTAMNSMGEKHQGLHIKFAQHETEIKVRIAAIEQNQSETREEIVKSKERTARVEKVIETHLNKSEGEKDGKRKLSENAKLIIAIISLLLGNGLLSVVFKAVGGGP